jgi:A/G-specific adenine glycosylase
MATAEPKMSDSDLRRTRRALLAFYDAHRRALPWREDPRPYRVWVSEVMLQQTRVEAVLPYYRAWMERFPDVGALAAASLDDVLKAWEGLGYYARARNLHRAALVVRDRMDGELPAGSAALRELPGFGEYTSGAVASIAFGERVPAVDGNVRRVLARLYDEAAPSAGWLRERAAALIDPARPGDFNQALMELGATVCTPRAPRCGACPLRDVCAARARGRVAERPRPRARKPVPDVEIAVAALVRSGAAGERELLLVRRPTEGLLGGLWEPPSAQVEDGAPVDAARRVAAARHAGVAQGEPVELPRVTQVYSHFRGIYRAFRWEVERGEESPAADAAWVDRGDLERRALPRAQRRIAASARAD